MTFHSSYIEPEFEAKTISRGPSGEGQLKTCVYRSAFKRVMDVFLVLATAPIIIPLVAALAGMIALRDGKPFYSQLRVGLGGKHYRIWKLRTMIHNADQALEAYLRDNPKARAEWDNSQKLRNDPRITPVGRLLRKTSLDELPQLWNVLNGTMSLVGPRPMMISQQSAYTGRGYYSLRPGITGLWQVSERNDSSFRDRARFDDGYNQTLSLKTDVSILVATVGVVVRGTGY